MGDLLRFEMKVFENGRLVQEYTSPPYCFPNMRDLADSLHRFWISASRVPACGVRAAGTPEIHLPPRKEGYGPDTCVVIVGTAAVKEGEFCEKCWILPPVWLCDDQFSGKHFFCDACARKQKGFRQSDNTHFVWEKLVAP